jgi:hypothetical protein
MNRTGIERKYAKLSPVASEWLSMVRQMPVAPLLAANMGDLIKPTAVDQECSQHSSVPEGMDYLAATGSALSELAKRFRTHQHGGCSQMGDHSFWQESPPIHHKSGAPVDCTFCFSKSHQNCIRRNNRGGPDEPPANVEKPWEVTTAFIFGDTSAVPKFRAFFARKRASVLEPPNSPAQSLRGAS